MIKTKWVKMLKLYRIKFFFIDPFLLKVYVLYSHLTFDDYGWPLI